MNFKKLWLSASSILLLSSCTNNEVSTSYYEPGPTRFSVVSGDYIAFENTVFRFDNDNQTVKIDHYETFEKFLSNETSKSNTYDFVYEELLYFWGTSKVEDESAIVVREDNLVYKFFYASYANLSDPSFIVTCGEENEIDPGSDLLTPLSQSEPMSLKDIPNGKYKSSVRTKYSLDGSTWLNTTYYIYAVIEDLKITVTRFPDVYVTPIIVCEDAPINGFDSNRIYSKEEGLSLLHFDPQTKTFELSQDHPQDRRGFNSVTMWPQMG